MALNPNHTFEDLGETKCAIVEKNCSSDRAAFLKRLLEINNFDVVVMKSPPPKAAKSAAPATDAAPVDVPAAETPLPPDTYSVGVTDLTFSPTNAVFNRELKTPEGAVVTISYWKQQETFPKEDEWYWKK